MNHNHEQFSFSLPFFFPDISVKESEILHEIIQDNKINFFLLRKFCYQDNLNSYPNLRPLFWRLLLCYLPSDIIAWTEVIQSNKILYKEYISEFSVKNACSEEMSNDSLMNKASLIEYKISNDHPLNVEKSSTWLNYFQDIELWNTIEKDTIRTRSEEGFFKEEVYIKYPNLTKTKTNKRKTEQHQDVMTRILFIFARKHPFINYVQGMNEILAPIYYCFAKEKNSFFADSIEEDSFTCFSLLMSEIKENFTKIKDCSLLGFKTRILLLDRLLKKVDPTLWNHLNNFCIITEIYSTRWILLLLTQDFTLEKILRVWDVLFSYQDKQEFVSFLSLAMIVISREEIMKNSFEEIHMAFKNIAKGKIELILEKADSIAREYKDGCYEE